MLDAEFFTERERRLINLLYKPQTLTQLNEQTKIPKRTIAYFFQRWKDNPYFILRKKHRKRSEKKTTLYWIELKPISENIFSTLKKDLSDKELFEATKNWQKALLKSKTLTENITYSFKEPTAIAFWFDLHIGGLGTDHQAIEQIAKLIKETENLYVFLGAEIVENYNVLSPDPKAEMVIPQRIQKIIAEYVLKTMRRKVLGIAQGDHEEWSKRSDDFEISEWLAKEAKTYNLEFGTSIFITIEEVKYEVYLRHRYIYSSRLNPFHTCLRAIDMLCPNADVVAIGHEHSPAIAECYKGGKKRILIRGGTNKLYDRFIMKAVGQRGHLDLPTVIFTKQGLYPFLDIIQAVNFLKKW